LKTAPSGFNLNSIYATAICQACEVGSGNVSAIERCGGMRKPGGEYHQKKKMPANIIKRDEQDASDQQNKRVKLEKSGGNEKGWKVRIWDL